MDLGNLQFLTDIQEPCLTYRWIDWALLALFIVPKIFYLTFSVCVIFVLQDVNQSEKNKIFCFSMNVSDLAT